MQKNIKVYTDTYTEKVPKKKISELSWTIEEKKSKKQVPEVKKVDIKPIEQLPPKSIEKVSLSIQL
jgi:hypothetical protein